MLNYCFAVYFVWRAQCVSETQMTVGVDYNDSFATKGGFLFIVIVPGFYCH